jgi:hypothetical protein
MQSAAPKSEISTAVVWPYPLQRHHMSRISTKHIKFPQKYGLKPPFTFSAIGVMFSSWEEKSSRRRERTRAIGEPVTELARDPGKELQENWKRSPQGSRERNSQRISTGVRKRTEDGTRKGTGQGTRKIIGDETRKGIRSEPRKRNRK